MSRSRNVNKNKRNIDYWANRPLSGCSAGSCRSGESVKVMTHRIERAREKQSTRKQWKVFEED